MYELRIQQVNGAAWAMIAISTLAVILRFWLLWLRRGPFLREDVLVLVAFAAFIALATVTLVVTPIAYHIANVQNDTIRQYEGVYEDEIFQLRTSFITSLLFPVILWSVKFSMVSILRRVTHRASSKAGWYSLFGFVVVTFIGCLIVNFTLCKSMADYFTPGACTADQDQKAQLANFYYVAIADILTDVLIMLYPIFLLRTIRLPRFGYLRAIGIFSVGILCIITATCRCITVGVSMGTNIPTFPWLSLWGLIECGIAVVVGCLPSYAMFFNKTRRDDTKTSTSHDHRESVHRGKAHTETKIESMRSYPSVVERSAPSLELRGILKTCDFQVDSGPERLG